MKKTLLSIAVLDLASFASGQPSDQTIRQPLMKEQDIMQQPRSRTSTTQTTTATEANGTITEYIPGSAIVLRETSGPAIASAGR